MDRRQEFHRRFDRESEVYRRASKEDKGRILNHGEEMTGYGPEVFGAFAE